MSTAGSERVVNTWPKPRVVVSRCLGSDRCRFDGSAIDDPFVRRLADFVEIIFVCPETEIGLGTPGAGTPGVSSGNPRDPLRLVEENGRVRLLQPASGKDVTAEMEAFTRRFLDGLGGAAPGEGSRGNASRRGPDGFLFKNRSPTCGPADVAVYRGIGKKAGRRKGSGLFGGGAAARFPGVPVADEGRLRSFTLRGHFLTAVFALARFGEVKRGGTASALVRFHTVNKLLLMGHNQAGMRELGRVVANPEKKPLPEVIAQYERLLRQALSKPPRFTSTINVLYHAFGGLSEGLSAKEKSFFQKSVEEYRDERIPLRAILAALEAWSIAQENRYLLEQTFIRPYPRELADIADSGKKREV
jgi:uncharacterized protein YbgA (DUF1722 family)/uncharacterized protein YbbK (DUF523 family)